jgi:hypothetical protein
MAFNYTQLVSALGSLGKPLPKAALRAELTWRCGCKVQFGYEAYYFTNVCSRKHELRLDSLIDRF